MSCEQINIFWHELFSYYSWKFSPRLSSCFMNFLISSFGFASQICVCSRTRVSPMPIVIDTCAFSYLSDAVTLSRYDSKSKNIACRQVRICFLVAFPVIFDHRTLISQSHGPVASLSKRSCAFRFSKESVISSFAVVCNVMSIIGKTFYTSMPGTSVSLEYCLCDRVITVSKSTNKPVLFTVLA